MVLAVPAPAVGDVVDEALGLEVRGLIGITAGVPAEQDVAARVRAAGARMIGPNCLGLYDASTELRLVWGTFVAGPLAIVSQSGQLGLEIAGLAASLGIGVSRFASVGNQADVTIQDVLDDLVDHEPTRVVALYAEDFGDGRALVRAIARLRKTGKPAVLLTVGGSDASREAARSHMGALTAPLAIVDAACRAAGAIRVRTAVEVAALARVLSSMKPAGERLAILTDSGGQGAAAADIASALGLQVARVSSELSTRLARWLPERASTRNPIDLAGSGEQDLGVYSRVVQALLERQEFDSVVLTGYFGCYGVDMPVLRQRRDTTVELAPVEPQQALEMVRRLRCAPLLDGWRGQSPVDIAGLIAMIVAVSQVIAERADIVELELNPVRVTVDGPLAVDALIAAVRQ